MGFFGRELPCLHTVAVDLLQRSNLACGRSEHDLSQPQTSFLFAQQLENL